METGKIAGASPAPPTNMTEGGGNRRRAGRNKVEPVEYNFGLISAINKLFFEQRPLPFDSALRGWFQGKQAAR